jgi:hypothetical protein
MFAALPGYVVFAASNSFSEKLGEIPPGWKTQSTGHLNVSIDRSCAFPNLVIPNFLCWARPKCGSIVVANSDTTFLVTIAKRNHKIHF